MLSNVSWTTFFVLFGIVCAIWAIWVYKDVILSKGRPPDEEPVARGKRIWSVADGSSNNSMVPRGIYENQYDQPGIELDEDEDEEDQTGHQLPGNPPRFRFQEEEEEKSQPGDFSQLEALANEIEALFSTDHVFTGNRELIDTIRPLIGKYPEVDNEVFRLTINSLVEKAAFATRQITLSREELDAMWQPASTDLPE